MICLLDEILGPHQKMRVKLHIILLHSQMQRQNQSHPHFKNDSDGSLLTLLMMESNDALSTSDRYKIYRVLLTICLADDGKHI